MKNIKDFEHKLTKACVSDLEQIILFEKQVLNDSSEYTSSRNLLRLIKANNSNSVFIVKNKKNQIYAYGIVSLRHYKNTPSGHIYKIAVLPEFRRIGLGTKLLKEIEKTVQKNNIFKIFAEVRESNKASLGLFQKLGYKAIKSLYAYYSCLDKSYELENGIKLCKTLYHK